MKNLKNKEHIVVNVDYTRDLDKYQEFVKQATKQMFAGGAIAFAGCLVMAVAIYLSEQPGIRIAAVCIGMTICFLGVHVAINGDILGYIKFKEGDVLVIKGKDESWHPAYRVVKVGKKHYLVEDITTDEKKEFHFETQNQFEVAISSVRTA